MAGIKMTHVPYKGTGQALIDLMAGQVQLTIANILSGLPYARSGRMRGLAVTGARRVKAAPEIPTVSESGVPGYDSATWYAVVAPAATPRVVINQLHADFTQALQLPDVRERLSAIGADLIGSSPEFLAQFIKSEIAKWAKIIEFSKARID